MASSSSCTSKSAVLAAWPAVSGRLAQRSANERGGGGAADCACRSHDADGLRSEDRSRCRSSRKLEDSPEKRAASRCRRGRRRASSRADRAAVRRSSGCGCGIGAPPLERADAASNNAAAGRSGGKSPSGGDAAGGAITASCAKRDERRAAATSARERVAAGPRRAMGAHAAAESSRSRFFCGPVEDMGALETASGDLSPRQRSEQPPPPPAPPSAARSAALNAADAESPEPKFSRKIPAKRHHGAAPSARDASASVSTGNDRQQREPKPAASGAHVHGPAPPSPPSDAGARTEVTCQR